MAGMDLLAIAEFQREVRHDRARPRAGRWRGKVSIESENPEIWPGMKSVDLSKAWLPVRLWWGFKATRNIRFWQDIALAKFVTEDYEGAISALAQAKFWFTVSGMARHVKARASQPERKSE